jgi:hypothetical protein
MRPSHVNCHRLKSLRPILEEWVRLNRSYAETLNWKDCAWWGNERASTSILAAAAWKAGGVALEEFSTRKLNKMGQKAGRCDLFFQAGTSKFACELKQVYPRLKARQNYKFSKEVEFLDWACSDAKKLFPEEGRQLGICIIAPRFPQSQTATMEQTLGGYLASLLQNKRQLKFHAVAWFFPKEGRRLKWENGKTYPGVIILIREISKN